MEKYKEILISLLKEKKDLPIEELANEIIKVSNSKNIVDCFTSKDIGEAYEIGRSHQDILGNLKEGWSADDIAEIWLRADKLYKGINWEDEKEI